MTDSREKEDKKQKWAQAIEESFVTRKPENTLDGLHWKSKLDVLYEELNVEENYQKAVDTEREQDTVRKKNKAGDSRS